MSRSGDCMGANSHELVWGGMTRPHFDWKLVNPGDNSPPVLAACQRAPGPVLLSAGCTAPKIVPDKNMQLREVGFSSSCREFGSK
jgi:hypothetical protein